MKRVERLVNRVEAFDPVHLSGMNRVASPSSPVSRQTDGKMRGEQAREES